jgi:hypothetical protein
MAEASEPPAKMSNVNESVAFSLLEDMKKSKKVTDDEFAHLKALYAAMHLGLAEAREKETFLVKAVRWRCSIS